MTGRMTGRRSAVLLSALTAVLAACGGGDGNGNRNGGQPAAMIVNRILDTQTVGTASDGDSETPPDRYNGPADLDAADRRTMSSSVVPTFDRVAGEAEAEAFDPASITLTEDRAIATSNNKVVTRLTVNAARPLTFDIDLDVDDVVARNDATVEIQVVASVLDDRGNTIPGAAITNTSFLFRADPFALVREATHTRDRDARERSRISERYGNADAPGQRGVGTTYRVRGS